MPKQRQLGAQEKWHVVPPGAGGLKELRVSIQPRAPEAECKKKSENWFGWKDRYAKVEGKALLFYDTKDAAEESSSSIRDLTACTVTSHDKEATPSIEVAASTTSTKTFSSPAGSSDSQRSCRHPLRGRRSASS